MEVFKTLIAREKRKMIKSFDLKSFVLDFFYKKKNLSLGSFFALKEETHDVVIGRKDHKAK